MQTFWKRMSHVYIKWFEMEIPILGGFVEVWEAETKSASVQET